MVILAANPRMNLTVQQRRFACCCPAGYAQRWASVIRVATVLILLLGPIGELSAQHLIKASGENCAHGLHQQPPGGPFSVFLFCDDAGGSNIGVINTEPGAGPGKIDLGESKEWKNWDLNNRFWQDPKWATDVTSFAWSPDLRFLYVATGEVYGTGSLYKLDLVARTSKKLVPDAATQKRIPKDTSTETEIKAIDVATGTLRVDLSFYNEKSKATEHVTVTVK